MKIFVGATLALLLSLPLQVAAQESGATPDLSNYSKATDLLPPSPNAASLGKYGGVQIGLSTGYMSHQMPLHTLRSTSLTLPILLSYAGSGLRVDEIAGRVGTGWNLEAGGVVTRTVYGAPDENTVRVSAPPARNTMAYIDYMRELSHANELGPVDGQPDVFSFNFSGYSGKFILDAQGQPVQLAHSNLKLSVSLGGTETSISITAPDGVQYFFGGVEATELTKKSTFGTGCGRDYTRFVPTAWYIKRIVHPHRDTIDFTYTPISFDYYTGISQTVYSLPTKSGECKDEGNCATLNSSTCLSQLSTNAVLLSEISSTAGERVRFSYVGRLDINDKLLSKVEVLRPSGAVLKEFTLGYQQVRAASYTNSHTTEQLRHRPFLLSVQESAPGSSQVRQHRFDYIGLNALPPRLSFAQDDYGFFNGKYNQTLIPTPGTESMKLAFPTATADRSSVASASEKGMLKVIHYPTGGSDSVMYEGNSVHRQVTIPPPSLAAQLRVRGEGLKTSKDTIEVIDLPYEQEVRVTADFQFDGTAGDGDILYQYDPLHHEGLLTVTKVLADGTREVKLREPLTAERPNVDLALILSDGNYEIWLEATGEPVDVAARISYTKDPPSFAMQNVQLAGVRVAKVITREGSAGQNKTKRYYYGALNSLGVSSGVTGFDPVYEGDVITRTSCLTFSDPAYPSKYVPCIEYLVCSYKTRHSNTQNNIYAAGAPIYYLDVVESAGESFEGGAVAYSFYANKDMPAQLLEGDEILGAPMTVVSWNNGKERLRKVFRKEGAAFVPVQEVITRYRTDNRVKATFTGYVAREKYTLECHYDPPNQMEYEAYDMMSYQHLQRWVYPDTVLTRTYSQDGLSYTEHVSVTEYANPVHALPTKVHGSTSSGETRTVSTLYPQDLSLSGEAEAARQWLVAAHMIASPLAQSITEASKQTVEVSIDYAVFPNGLAHPRSNSMRVGSNPMERRVEFLGYSDKGKLLGQAMTGGAPSSYVYSYAGALPVASAVNAAQNEVFHANFEEPGGWEGNMQLDSGRTRTGLLSGKLDKATAGELTSLSATWLDLTPGSDAGLSQARRFRYSAWVYSEGPSADIYLFMKTKADYEAGAYFSQVDFARSSTVGKWVLLEKEFEVPAGIKYLNVRLNNNGGGIVWFDDVRLHPSEAQMTTYTHDPLVGVTSVTDANGRTAYYEYDAFGRLKAVRDDEGNVLKAHEYHYKQ